MYYGRFLWNSFPPWQALWVAGGPCVCGGRPMPVSVPPQEPSCSCLGTGQSLVCLAETLLESNVYVYSSFMMTQIHFAYIYVACTCGLCCYLWIWIVGLVYNFCWSSLSVCDIHVHVCELMQRQVAPCTHITSPMISHYSSSAGYWYGGGGVGPCASFGWTL